MQEKTRLLTCFSFFFSTCFAQQLKLVLPIGHTDKIYEAQFSPDGKKVVTASKDKTAKIWDVASGSLLADLKGHTAPVTNAQFSPDGKLILTHSYDLNSWDDNKGHVKIWNAGSGEFITDLPDAFEITATAAFSPDSRNILTISDTSKLWSANTGKLLVRLKGKTDRVSMAQFSPDGNWIAAATKDNSIIIYNAKTGLEIRRLKNHTSVVKAIKFTPDSKKMISASLNETINWDATDWKLAGIITGQIEGDHDEFSDDPLFFTTDGQKIVTGDFKPSKKKITVWNAAGRKLLLTKNGNINSGEQADLFEQDNGLRGNIVAASAEKFAAVLNTASHNNLQIGLENDKTAFLWNLSNGQLVDSLTGHTDAINYIQFNGDGTKLVTASDDGTVKIWDALNGKLISDLRSHTFNSRDADFSPGTIDAPAGGKYISTASDDGSVRTWDLSTGTLATTYKSKHTNLFSVKYSAGGNKIVSGSQDGSVIILDAVSGKVYEFTETSTVRIDPTSEADMEVVTRVVPPELSRDGTKLLAAIQSNTAKVFDVATGKLLFKQSSSRYPGISFAHFSPDGNKIVTGYRYYDNFRNPGDTNTIVLDLLSEKTLFKVEAGSAYFSPDNSKLIVDASNHRFAVDAENGKFLYNIKANKINGTYSPDSNRTITWSDNFGIVLQDAKTAKIINTLQSHTDDINFFEFSPDSKYIVSTSRDNTAKIWDGTSGKLIYTFFGLDSSDYFVQLPSGYYKSTPNASKLLHYVTKDLNIISFEQLDVKYNRPDLVLRSIGNTDTALINTYQNAYYKRIKKLGIDTTAFRDGYSIPQADFVNRPNIEFDQKDENLVLHVKGFDSSYQLDRFNIWVNEVPVYGQRGNNIRQINSKSIDKTVTIKLSLGENRIETSVANINGTESYRMPLIVNYMPTTMPKETTYFIGIGIDKFADAAYNLNYSTKDIRDLAVKLKEKYGTEMIIDTLFNENVTIKNVKALKQKLLQSTVNDKIIISYSGHGLLSKEYDYYLSTYSVNFKSPEENGLAYDELESLLDSIPARKKLMLIDACHSGEVDKEEFQQVEINKAALDSNHIVSKGVVVTSTGIGSKKLGLKNSFELMQNLFVNVGKSTGATIISAAAGTELALEKGDLKNGVFTYCILEALEKYPTMKISELKKTVGARVEELTNGIQRPTSRNEAIAVDWNVW